MNDETPIDPFKRLGQIVTVAVTLHEIFESFKDAGFTEEQAMELVKAMVQPGPA